jgi:hypothetical protein
MGYKLVEGRFVNEETGEAVSSEELKKIRKDLGFLSREEADHETSIALENRANKLADKKAEDRLKKEMEKLNADKSASDEEKRVLQRQIDELEEQKLSAEERVQKKYQQDLLEKDNNIKYLKDKYDHLENSHRNSIAENKLRSLAEKHNAVVDDFVGLLRTKEEWIESEDDQSQKILRYRVDIYDETTKEFKETLVSPEKAAEVFAETKPHLIKSSNRSGMNIDYTGGKRPLESMSIDEIGKRFR